MDCDRVDDEDVVGGLEYGYCFGFGGEVVEKAAVAVFVGDYGLDLDGSVIGDDKDDDDWDDCGVVVFLLREYLSISFYI